MSRRIEPVALCAILALGLPGAALAVDGTKLIDQARALAGGLTPGDGPGFPVVISQPGSYRLSGNLTVPDAVTTAIQITAENVTLDLNGFTIAGPTVCSGFPPVCTPLGAGVGVLSEVNYITVRNGIIRGMGAEGLRLRRPPGEGDTHGHQVSDLQVVSNGADGITIGTGIVRSSVARRNGENGIAIAGGVVSGNLVAQNLGSGVRLTGTGLVADNQISDNAGCGVSAPSGLIRHNNLLQNNPGRCLSGATGYLGNTLIGSDPGGGGLNLGQNLCGSSASPVVPCP